MRLILKTKDGSLIADQELDVSYYWKYGQLDKEWTEYRIGVCCRTKGVKLVSYTPEVVKYQLININVLVEWF